MPGILRPDLDCPMCGKHVICVFHEWSGSQDTATFEYHHHDDPQREREDLEPQPCRAVLPYAEGLARMKSESP
jgi:hypothetical protein